MSIGMTYEEFWEKDPTITRFYLKAYQERRKREQEITEWNIWKQGAYIYEALIDVAPILRTFSKAKKPQPYSEKPYGIDEYEKENKTEKEKENEKENERLRAILYFKRWAKATSKQFKNEKR